MDLGARRHYVARAMEFLLILSAMLSAVTGAFTGARAPEPRLHHPAAQVAAVAAPCAEAAVVARRSAAALPGIALVAAVFETPRVALAAPAPLFAVRLNE
jgi:hypothetical protein